MTLSAEDRESLWDAVRWLENPGFAARLANMVGEPFEKILAMLPGSVTTTVQEAVTSAIRRSLEVAVYKIGDASRGRPSDTLLKAVTGATGGVGGFFGIPALAIELPVTTTVMLRSIADIARSEGEDLRRPEARLACLEVFALGGRSAGDDRTETGYYAVRTALARAISEAAKFIAERGLAEEGAPILVRLISTIAARFGVVVSEKVAAVTVPVVGAIGGATINVLFMDHFQSMAHGHFTVRRLERKYGAEVVRREYELCRQQAAYTPG